MNNDLNYPWDPALDCIAYDFPQELYDIQMQREQDYVHAHLHKKTQPKIWDEKKLTYSPMKFATRKVYRVSLPRWWNSSLNFTCINCIPAFAACSLCFSSYNSNLKLVNDEQ